jgi:hypothetical protein
MLCPSMVAIVGSSSLIPPKKRFLGDLQDVHDGRTQAFDLLQFF